MAKLSEEQLLDAPIQSAWVTRIAWRSLGYYQRLRKVREHLEGHFQEPFTVRDASAVACCDYKYFSSFFRAKVNVRFTDWVRLMRVAEAARLMERGDYAIEDVARRVGFRNIRALERAFRRFCGMPPSTFGNSVRDGITATGRHAPAHYGPGT